MNIITFTKGYIIHALNTSRLFLQGNHIVRGATTTFGLKISATSISLIVNVLLARLLGKTGLGIYAFALSLVSILSIPATLGFRKLLVREVSICKAKSIWNEFHGLIRWTNTFILTLSICLAFLTYIIFKTFISEIDSAVAEAVAISLLLLPIESLTILRASTLQGLDKIIISQLPEYLLVPLFSLVLIIIIFVIYGENFSVNYVIFARVLAFYGALNIGSIWLKKSLPLEVRQTPPKFHVRKWLSAAFPLMFLEGMRTIHHHTDALMLGSMLGPESVGVYAVMSKGVMLVVFVLGAVDTALSPVIAKLYTLGNIEQLQRIITKSSQSIFITSSLVTLGFVFFGHWFLLIFGDEFLEGEIALNILCIGKMIGALTTSSAFLLTMTGHERHIIVSSTFCSMMNIVLNFLFIPRWGLEGAAIATSFSNIFMHFWNGFSVWKTTGINPTPFFWRFKPI